MGDHSDVDGDLVADSELAISSRDYPAALEPLDHALHRLAFALADVARLAETARIGVRRRASCPTPALQDTSVMKRM